MINELDVVVLIEDIPEKNLKKEIREQSFLSAITIKLVKLNLQTIMETPLML